MGSMNSEPGTALVTGSTRGIGRAVAERLLADGWTVGVNGRDHDATAAVASDLGERAVPVPFDVNDAAAVLAGFAAFRRAASRLDAVVHSAGQMRDAPLGLLTEELVTEQLAVNVAGSLYVAQAAARVMGRGGGAIVLIGSIVGEDGSAGQTLYAATKAAVGGITRSAAKELGPRGIRVNYVVPGIIDTDLIAGVPAEARAEFAARTPLRRNGEPADIADVVSFLVSDGARYITGEQVRVSGGLRLS
jgi:3-oxoacyl-[acyl-carrier protein] reductase